MPSYVTLFLINLNKSWEQFRTQNCTKTLDAQVNKLINPRKLLHKFLQTILPVSSI
jgi:hypothetical protein